MKKLLVIAHVWPEPKSSAAGSRLVHLMHLLSGEFKEITLISAADPGPYSHDFTGTGIRSVQVKLNDSALDTLLQELQPDVVLFDRFMTEEQFGWRVREQVPQAMTVLDTEDLHFLRQARAEAVKAGKDYRDAFLYSDFAKREIAALLRCDLSLVISEVEMQLLEKMQVPATLLHYIPLLTEEIPANQPGFNERQHFLFIGNGFHEPNVDAILQLKKEIWPRVRKHLPGVELHVYGAYLPEKITQLNKASEGFHMKGRAEEVSIVMQQSRVFLAPLRFGAGQKGKLLEAMLYGLPNVTTSIGAESMNGELSWPGEMTDDWESFAEAAIHLYRNEERWKISVQQGKEILQKRFRTDLFKTGLVQRISGIQETLETHRQNHFIGQILQINALNSYKYFSLWIEEKNKKSN